MPSDESLQPDASTVHRSADPPPEEFVSPAHGLDEDVEPIEQAKTVIRGSSRIDRPAGRVDSIDRTPVAVAKVLLGQRLNHFRLEELIGGGGMGAVFRAHDEQLDRTVAIKVVPFVGDDPDLQRRFRNEAQSAAKLDHPRIARVFDVGSHDEWHYIVFEYIEGTNIRDLVSKHGVLSIDEAVFNTSQLAGALQHAADRGIVHRDIKPSNVLIGEAGKIKLVDMGLARSDNLDLSEDMTASGVTLGTFDYISPEQAHDPRQADLRSDIYSLGCTLYFMLTGRPPYPGGTMLQKLLSHGNAPPPDARELRPEVSDNLVAVIAKMLAKDPQHRYQTATDLIADLREVAFRDGLVRSQSLSPVAISQPNPLLVWLERHAPWMVAAMLLLASAGWLHLESAALRSEIPIPSSAKPPQILVPDTSRSSRSAGDGQASAGSLSAVASDPPTPASATSDSFRAGSAGQPEPFRPFDEPPQLKIPVPSELMSNNDEADSVVPMPENLDDVLASEAPFSVHSRLLIGEENVSLEPLDGTVPYVVRLMGPDLEPGYERDEEGAALAPTLSRALEMVAQYSASRLEIAVPVVYSGPVKVPVDDLLIKSTVGGSMIVFQPDGPADMERSGMFSIGSHQIELEDLHFVWNLPLGNIDGGALFELHENDFVEMTDCSITIANSAQREEVYAFDVLTDPGMLPRQRRELSARDAFPLVRLKLNNVAVRGQMTMLHMDHAARLLLSWENGLLAITDRMIDTAGARQKPAVADPTIALSLTRVTAHAPKGLVRMRIGVGGAYPLAIERTAMNSVFIVDSDASHFEIAGLRSLDIPSPLLQLRGEANAYAVEPSLEDHVLRLSTIDGEMEITPIRDLVMEPPRWANESSPRWSVNWSDERFTSDPAHQRTPADYRQEGSSPPGFDEKYLPAVRGLDGLRGRDGSPAADRSPKLDTTDENLSTTRAALQISAIREER